MEEGYRDATLNPLFDRLAALRADPLFRPPAPRRQPYELVVVVHGTFANAEFPAYPKDTWWSDYGSFAKAVEAALGRHGSPARCSGPHFARDTQRFWLGWSGANSEVDRRKAAEDLAGYLCSLQDDDEVLGFHVVAHSHGGNVVRRAFRYMNEPTRKLGRVVCLGTPFLHFRDRARWRRWFARVHWPMLLVLAGLLAFTWWRRELLERRENMLLFYWLTALLGTTLIALWRFGRKMQASSIEVPMTLVRFAHDEAIQLLRACATFVGAPHLLLRDVLGGPASRRERRERPAGRDDGWIDKTFAAFSAAGRTAWNGFAFCSDLWSGPVCRLAERVTTGFFRIPVVGGVAGSLGTLALLMLFRPYRPPLRPLLTTRLPRFKTLFNQPFTQHVEDEHRTLAQKADWLTNTPFSPEAFFGVAAFLPLVLYWLAIYPIDKFLGLFPWLGAVGTRFFIVVGARAAAAGAPGMDMFGGAFDARKTGNAPTGVDVVIIPDAIEADLEKTLDAKTRVDLSPLRRALDPSRHMLLLDAVKTAFTDPGLLHAQYYQDERIVDYIAQLIAQPRASQPWQETAGEGTAATTTQEGS